MKKATIYRIGQYMIGPAILLVIYIAGLYIPGVWDCAANLWECFIALLIIYGIGRSTLYLILAIRSKDRNRIKGTLFWFAICSALTCFVLFFGTPSLFDRLAEHFS